MSGATGLPVLSDVCNVQHPVIAKIFELVTNFLISHKNEARSCLGSVWCILVLQLFFFYMLKGIISTHKSLFLCLQKQTAGVMASRDPGDDRTSVSGSGPTSTGLTLTTTSVVYRPR